MTNTVHKTLVKRGIFFWKFSTQSLRKTITTTSVNISLKEWTIFLITKLNFLVAHTNDRKIKTINIHRSKFRIFTNVYRNIAYRLCTIRFKYFQNYWKYKILTARKVKFSCALLYSDCATAFWIFKSNWLLEFLVSYHW